MTSDRSSDLESHDWDARVDAVWASASDREEREVIAEVEALIAERAGDEPKVLFERAGVLDFAGREAEAAPLYEAALAAGLDDDRRSRAVIQLASTLRNLGRHDEAIELLEGEYPPDSTHERASIAHAFRALALVSADRPVEGAALALETLAGLLPEYGRAVRYYAGELRSPE